MAESTRGGPADPAAYQYDRAARDALAFAALFDRFIQDLRRYLGYDVQYFAAVEPQKDWPRTSTSPCAALSPAPRSAASPPPPTTRSGGPPPPSSSTTGTSCRSGTRRPATTSTWPPGKCCPPGTRPSTPSATMTSRGTWPGSATGSTPKGVLAGSKDASRCTGYLTKQVDHCYQADTDAQRAHVARLAEALRYQPCSPRCANWLRYGIQPKNARPGLVPGCCKRKAHDADHLGYPGRRVLVSRKWSGKTLADHRADRQAWLLATLGVSATDPARHAWELLAPTDPDYMEHARRLLHAVADRARWQAALHEARRRAQSGSDDLPATGTAAA
jgi:hypothetical protein